MRSCMGRLGRGLSPWCPPPPPGPAVLQTVKLDKELFSVENDLLTPTFKLKRPQLQKRYQADIDAMYAALGQ